MHWHPGILVPLLILGLAVPHTRVFGVDCSHLPGSRPITLEESALTGIEPGTCYRPTDTGVNSDSVAAKRYLATKLTGAAAGRGEVSVSKMNNTYACRLADFMRASDASGLDIKIFSGWRDEAAQRNAVTNSRPGYACTGGANCPHPQGRAADLSFGGVVPKTTAACNANPACRWAHANAARFSLAFPLSGNPLEPWHIEPVERANVPTNGPCGSGGAPAPSASAAPLGGGDLLRQALGMQQQPMLMPSMPAMPSQPVSQQQSPLSAFNPTPISQPSPISGQLGSTPIPTGTATSVSDQLLALLNATTSSATSTNTGTSAPIVISGTNTGTIVVTTHSSATQQYGSGSLQPVGQQTFVTSDVQQPSSNPAQNTGRLVQLYTQLRDVLIRILDIVRPFGGSRSSTQYVPVDQADEFLELD